MTNTLERPSNDIEEVIHTYGNMVFRLCLITLGNDTDAQDAMQETFIKYLLKSPEFQSEEHKKAWIIKVASNQCKDILRFKKRHQMTNLDGIKEYTEDNQETGILDALMILPDKFRIVLFLYYVEEYDVKSIADMIGKTLSAVKMRLKKGRKLLKEVYERNI